MREANVSKTKSRASLTSKDASPVLLKAESEQFCGVFLLVRSQGLMGSDGGENLRWCLLGRGHSQSQILVIGCEGRN